MRRTISTVITVVVMTSALSSIISCNHENASETPDNAQGDITAGIVARWDYPSLKGYDPEISPGFEPDSGGLIDATAITSANINEKDYLILSFAPHSSLYSSRIFIFDTENPLSPQLISTIALEKQENVGFLVSSAAVRDNILYCSLFLDKGLWMVDISDPAHPQDLGIAPVEVTSNLIVTGDIAYGSGQMYDGVSVSDVSDVRNVGEIARIDLSTREHWLAVSRDHLFVGIGQTLTVYDVSIPSSPEQVGTCVLEVSQDLVTELPFPEPGQIHWANWANIIDLQASGDYVYVTFGAGQLRIIDVSDPAAPHEVADVDLGGFAIALTLEDDLLYVTKSDAETQLLQLCIVDISNPESPGLLDTIVTESIFGFGGATYGYCWMRPQVIGNYIYVAGLNYMDIMDIIEIR